jgi:hypothetical protein
MYSLNIWIVNIFEGTLVVNNADTLPSITAATSKTPPLLCPVDSPNLHLVVTTS